MTYLFRKKSDDRNIHLLKCTHENNRILTEEEVQKLIAKPTKINFTEVRILMDSIH